MRLYVSAKWSATFFRLLFVLPFRIWKHQKFTWLLKSKLSFLKLFERVAAWIDRTVWDVAAAPFLRYVGFQKKWISKGGYYKIYYKIYYKKSKNACFKNTNWKKQLRISALTWLISTGTVERTKTIVYRSCHSSLDPFWLITRLLSSTSSPYL